MVRMQGGGAGDWNMRKLRRPPKGRRGRRETAAESILPREFLQEDSVKIEDVYEFEPKPIEGRRAISPPELALDVDVKNEEGCLLAIRHVSGALTFHSSSETIHGPRRQGSSAEAMARFRVPLRRVANQSGRRGIISKAIKVVVMKVAKAAIDKAVSFILPELAKKFEEWSWSKRNLAEGWFQIRPSRNNESTLRLTRGFPKPGKRNLLLIHGTFSHATSAFASLTDGDFFDRVRPIYGDRIYAFNHFTVSRTPSENAHDLLSGLADHVHQFDVITHSRGGLVLRSLVELASNFGSNSRRFQLNHAVLVASPNDGTPLARPTRWEETVGWVANLLEIFPDNPFTTGAEFVSEAIVWLASHIAGDLPGLHSMDEAGEVLADLQAPPSPPQDAYSALVANFHPDTALWERILDVGVDHFFGSANDLVVPTEGGWMIDRDGMPYISANRIGCFGPGGNIITSNSGTVNHVNFFKQSETTDFLAKALLGEPHSLAEVDLGTPLPHRRLARSASIAAALPSVSAQPSRIPAAPVSVSRKPSHLPMGDDYDTFHIVVMDTDRDSGSQNDRQARFARVFASYGGARVVERMRLRAKENEPSTSFGTIIRFHERIKDYTNRVKGRLPSDSQMREFGSALFETLFQGDVRRLYDEARSRQRGRKLDLVLTSMIPWLAEKPWEFCYDAARASFLATEEIHFVRNVLTAIPAEAMVEEMGPLRILVASAQPVGFGRLSINQELEVIRRGFEPLIEANLATVEVLPRATPSSIHGYLSTGNYNVVHFIGHGEFDENEQEGYLIFENARGGSFRLGQRPVREILCQRGVHLVFLNACQTGTGGKADFNKGVAQALVAHGLPSLVANQYSVLDSSATSFAQHFYWSLSQGMTLGEAAREARIAVNYSLQGEHIDWAVPVVYAQDPNRALCRPPSVRATVPVTAVRTTSRRAISSHSTHIAVWDIDHVFPGLESTLDTMNRAQSCYGFELVDLSLPLDVWDLEEDEETPYLYAELLAQRVQSATVQLQVDLLACITRHWLRDEDTLNLYGWWPSEQAQKVVIFSCAGFDDLPVEGHDTNQAIANVSVTAITGFFGDLGTHKRGPKTCPLYVNDDRELKYLKGKQTFDPRCQQQINRLLPGKLHDLKALLNAFN